MADAQPVKFPSWKGAWPQEVFFSFYELTSEDSIRATEAGRLYKWEGLPLDALANPVAARQKRTEHHLQQFHAHDGYKRLQAFAGFNGVCTAREKAAIQNVLFTEPFGEMRLLHIVSILVANFDPAFIPKRATLARQRKVLRAARVLAGLLMPGAQPAIGDGGSGSLRKNLSNFVTHLDKVITEAELARTRPHRADKDAAQRYWLITFCKKLFDVFQEAPAPIVLEVAAMLGYTPNAVTVDRYIEAGRQQHIDAKTDTDPCNK